MILTMNEYRMRWIQMILTMNEYKEWDEYKLFWWINDYRMRWIQIIRMNEWIQNRMNTNYSDEWMNTEWGEYKLLGWMNEYIMR